MVADDELSGEPSGTPLIRFDQAHKIPSAAELQSSSHEQLSAVAEIKIDASEQMQVQANQLARHLQERRREVDHREAHLNARIAHLENDLRVSRLWLRERSEEFELRESELSQKIAEQESQIRGLSASESEMDHVRQEYEQHLQARELKITQREELVAESQRRFVAETESLNRAREELADDRAKMQVELPAGQRREVVLREMEQNLQRRQQRLDEQEGSLDHQWRQIQAEREESQQRIAEAHEQLRQDRQKMQEQRRQFDEQRNRHQKISVSRQERIDEQQIVLQRIRDDILRLHREALEMRLIAEQLWSQMTGRLAPTELTEGLSKLRSQLTDEFRLAHHALANQRAELESLITRLDEKRRELATQRDELMGWFARRQNDLAQQGSALAQREQQFLDEKQHVGELEQRWQHERRDLQRQIRKLTLQIRSYDLVAA